MEFMDGRNLVEKVNHWKKTMEMVSSVAVKLHDEVFSSFKEHRIPLALWSFSILPALRIEGGCICCNGIKVDFGQNSLPIKLFRAFMNNPGKSMTKDALIQYVYEIENTRLLSDRYRTTLELKLNKLISRTRLLANKGFNSRGTYWIEWFCHNQTSDSWCFYRLTNQYLQVKEEQLYAVLAQNDKFPVEKDKILVSSNRN